MAPTMAPPTTGRKRSAASPPASEEERGGWSGIGGPRADGGEAPDRGEKLDLADHGHSQLAELLRAAELGGRGGEEPLPDLLQGLAQRLGLAGAEEW